MKVFKLFFLSIILFGCTKAELDTPFIVLDDASPYEWGYNSVNARASIDTSSLAFKCMIKRARQIACIQWTPNGTIPKAGGAYPPNKVRTGIPYSSVKELDKFIGQEVSFTTFMSAVHNPRSVLYTENVSQPPYSGVNCSTYYGTVCSMAVNYALGIDYPIESSMYPTLSLFEEVAQKSLTNALPGDIVWRKGHVFLLLDIVRLGKEITSVSVLESRNVTSIKTYSYDALLSSIEKYDWVVYRFKYLAGSTNYKPIPFIINEGDEHCEYNYNEELCVNRGDESSFREGENVVIDVFSSAYDQALVYKDGVLFRTLDIETDKIVLSGLPFGDYSVQLKDDDSVSKPTYFEVIQTEVSMRKCGVSVFLNASSKNASIKYIVYCTSTGARKRIIPVSHDTEESDTFVIPSPNTHGLYLKVFFKGKYGLVSNEPIEF